MKIKLLGTDGKLLSSLLFSICYLLINALTYIACVWLAVFVVFPSVSLYSEALFNKMVDPLGNVTFGAGVAACIVAMLISVCVAAVSSVSLERRRRKQFFLETFGLINEKEGFAWYINKYGIMNAVAVGVLTLTVGIVVCTGVLDIFVLLLPQLAVIVGIFANIPAVILCALINFASVFYGILLGMRKWRVFCMCKD